MEAARVTGVIGQTALKARRAKARAALIEKYWGNATMGNPGVSRDVAKLYSFMQIQEQRRESWEHGMKHGFGQA